MHTTFTSRARTAIVATALGGALVLSACGGDPTPLNSPAAAAAPETTTPPATTSPPAETPAAADAPVKITQTVLGDVLADADGMALYAFTNDVEAKSTCEGTCAEAWPPVIVDPSFVVSPGLDSGIFATTVREDGSHQLVAGKWPLYRYAADATPGDITGQGSGDVWYLVDLQGRLIETPIPADDAAAPAEATETPETTAPAEATTEAATESTDAYGDASGESSDDAEESAIEEPAIAAQPLLAVSDTGLGQILTDPDGFVLYLFAPDEAGEPTCTGGCAGAWPPLLVDDGVELAAAGIDPALLSMVAHPDGGMQLRIGKWPLYYFAGDEAAGQTNGQGSGGNWFVVGTDSKPIR